MIPTYVGKKPVPHRLELLIPYFDPPLALFVRAGYPTLQLVHVSRGGAKEPPTLGVKVTGVARAAKRSAIRVVVDPTPQMRADGL